MTEQLQEAQSSRLPHNLEAERALLGSMVLDNRQIDIALNVLPPGAVQAALGRRERRRGEPPGEALFFSSAHQTIFGAIIALHEVSGSVDLTTLAEELHRRAQLETVGGSTYLASLEDDIFSLGQVAQYADLVAQKWRLRALIRTAQSIAEDAAQSDESAQEIIDRSEKRIFQIAQEQEHKDFIPIGDAVVDQIQEIERRAKGGMELPGLPTGFVLLDRLTTGLRPANLIVVAARPSMGKTALAMNIATHAAIKHGRPVGIFSLEMSVNELTMRLMCTLAHVSMSRVRGSHKLRPDELEALHEAAAKLDVAPMHIDDASSLSILEMRSRARRLKAKCPDLALIVVDYLQLMYAGTGTRIENRQQEVTEISRSLKELARELNLPVLAVSQLSRQSEQRRGRGDKLPRLSDLRESGAIEQDADLVIFVQRDLNTGDAPQSSHEPEIAIIKIGKQRNGPIGQFELLFRGEFTEFVDLAKSIP